jgi:hypothetical protein
MKGIWYLAAITLVAVFGLLWQGEEAVASNAIAKKEDMVCTSCHDKPGSKLLTDQGKYYELMGSLDGFEEVETFFGQCTSCHVKKPGSLKLTSTGRRFQRLVGDMDGLKELLEGEHPQPPEMVDDEQSNRLP